jgi:carbonic anhydrase
MVFEVVWRYDPAAGVKEQQPQTAAEARERLDSGSAAFARLLSEGGRHIVTLPADAFGIAATPHSKILQEPFAAVLGCADARVPAELIFGQAVNDLFVVRVAGNVPGTECLGSLDYALSHLPSLRLLAVVAHSGCGAVSAAVDAMLKPETYFEVAANPDLRAIVDAIMAAVTLSADALSDVHGPGVAQHPGYRAALIETAVVVNAALTAVLIQRAARPVRGKGLGIVFGVYDLARRSVGLPATGGWLAGLADPPESAAALDALAHRVAAAIPPTSL